jgi:heme-degrading monooxygenase HmoA
MFVELLSWTVPGSQKESSLNLLRALHHQMDTSGGMVRSLVGREVHNPDCLVSLTFWKSWEDVARFLASSGSSMLNEHRNNSSERPKPHHFEILWEWPQEEVDTKSGECFWSIHQFYPEPAAMNRLLDGLRHWAPSLSARGGFHCAALWLDKNNDSHVALATQWTGDGAPEVELPEEIRAAAGRSTLIVARVRVTDQYHLGVV